MLPSAVFTVHLFSAEPGVFVWAGGAHFATFWLPSFTLQPEARDLCQSPSSNQKAHCDDDNNNNNNTILTGLAQTRVSMDLWIWESILKQSGCAVGCVDISILTDSAPLTGSSAQGAESQPCFLLLKRSLMLLSDNSLPAASRPLFWSQLSEWWGWLRLEQWAPFVLLKGDRKHWFQPLPGL